MRSEDPTREYVLGMRSGNAFIFTELKYSSCDSKSLQHLLLFNNKEFSESNILVRIG